jgi:hypothetical protein
LALSSITDFPSKFEFEFYSLLLPKHYVIFSSVIVYTSLQYTPDVWHFI